MMQSACYYTASDERTYRNRRFHPKRRHAVVLEPRELSRDGARSVLEVEVLASGTLRFWNQAAHKSHELLAVQSRVVLKNHAVVSSTQRTRSAQSNSVQAIRAFSTKVRLRHGHSSNTTCCCERLRCQRSCTPCFPQRCSCRDAALGIQETTYTAKQIISVLPELHPTDARNPASINSVRSLLQRPRVVVFWRSLQERARELFLLQVGLHERDALQVLHLALDLRQARSGFRHFGSNAFYRRLSQFIRMEQQHGQYQHPYRRREPPCRRSSILTIIRFNFLEQYL